VTFSLRNILWLIIGSALDPSQLFASVEISFIGLGICITGRIVLIAMEFWPSGLLKSLDFFLN
jgi:hypothetical protein